MLEKLKEIEQTALSTLESVKDQAALEAWRVAHLGRSSPVMGVFSGLGQLSKEERPAVGQAANKVKVALEAAFAERTEAVKAAMLAKSLEEEELDVTLPGRGIRVGRLHPSTQQLRRVVDILVRDGLPGLHLPRSRNGRDQLPGAQLPAAPPCSRIAGHALHRCWRSWRQSHCAANTYLAWTNPRHARSQLKRTLTIRHPSALLLPGMCFRSEQITARSEVQFNQVEGLAVGENITFADLKGTLSDFARRMFGQNVRTRFRASYFPFTEPSAEMDVECFVCGGEGCSVCKQSGWLEILGCGMVHPVVLQNGGYDPKRYTGYAFGMGPGTPVDAAL